MNLRTVLSACAACAVLLLVALAAAIAFGGPTRPQPMLSISNPFRNVDYSALPPLSHYAARDGTQLAYRRYAPAGGAAARGSVVLVHGSSANSQSVHPLAQSLAGAGFAVYALDIRGHGDSGPHGDIAYIGQLDDDLQDFTGSVRPPRPSTLAGFSSGGGFAIRVAGGARQALFDNYLFLAPYTSRRAASFRPNAGGWVAVGVPRVVALTLLNRIGVTRYNHLPVVAFAVGNASAAGLVGTYSYALVTNFQPDEAYQDDIRAIREPAAVLAGVDDEVFLAARFAQVFAEAGRPDIPVTLVPGSGHIGLTLDAQARAAVVAAVAKLDAATRPMPASASQAPAPIGERAY
ncbi:alpha/beta hydrolase [Cupriavidus malaysiensis]|uniref:Alpha/beta hydrolase n=1 Tax=Cupriavidus malaysiensis TaxID=367825 RepID=A0A1D9I1Y8_9BURK|nr:alpha/beta fold hydrolase [Cupriavidus malaysiensis]AOZ06063.1 alpha/beta hydrolase [Cupriavidus malaysiensis]